MTQETVHLPNGQTYIVSSVADGFLFRSNQFAAHETTCFPVGWTIGLHTEGEKEKRSGQGDDGSCLFSAQLPTRNNDVLVLFLVSVSVSSGAGGETTTVPLSLSSSNQEYRLRQVAMMLWVSLHWYFHRREPPPTVTPTPDASSVDDDWSVTVWRRDEDGVDEDVLAELARMSLLATRATNAGKRRSHVGDDKDDVASRMFVTQRMFWQLPPSAFLLSPEPIAPTLKISAGGGGGEAAKVPISTTAVVTDGGGLSSQLVVAHLPPQPACYPPLALQYTVSEGVRHPLRPRPPQMSAVLYTRFLPSVGRYLSFRVASTSPSPVPYLGPVGPKKDKRDSDDDDDNHRDHIKTLSDTQLLEMWFAKPRVSDFWGAWNPSFLADALGRRHSFPVIGLWDGVPFGYFEIYWVREDILGRVLDGEGDEVGDFDRGLHVLVGEEWARGRAAEWMTSLVHWCLVADVRTMNVCMEPRIDNERISKHLDASGFRRVKQVTFPHKTSWFVRLRRETWTGPLL